MIQVAKWLIVAGLLFPILACLSINYQSIETYVYREFPGLISYLLQTVGWILLLVSAKDKHWKLASGIFSFGMAICSIMVVLKIMCFYNCIAMSNSETYSGSNVIIEYYKSTAIYDFCISAIEFVLLGVLVFPILSVGGTQRYKTSVSVCLIAFLLPTILYLGNVADFLSLKHFNMLDYYFSDSNYGRKIYGYIPSFFCLVFGAFAFGRMITLYEQGEGDSDSPLLAKKIFTSRCFMAAIFFLFVCIFTQLIKFKS